MVCATARETPLSGKVHARTAKYSVAYWRLLLLRILLEGTAAALALNRRQVAYDLCVGIDSWLQLRLIDNYKEALLLLQLWL